MVDKFGFRLEVMLQVIDFKVLDQAIAKLLQNDLGLLLIAVSVLFFAFKLISILFALSNFIWVYFLRPTPNLRQYGSWAVVTGATDGIGKAYCYAFAKKGLNILLVSRTQSKLDEVAADIASKFGVETKTCAADLCSADGKIFDTLDAAMKGLDIGILVNNAGMSYDHAEYLDDLDPSLITDMVNINVVAPTMLTKMVIPGMKARGRGGAIVNLGSGSGLIPACPLLSVYAGTKAYIDMFSKSLHAEFSKDNIRVQDQAPFFVATKLAKIRKARFDVPTPEKFVKSAIKCVGKESSISPYWFHALMLKSMQLAPESTMISKVKSMHLSLRAAYFRKQAKKEAEEAATAVADAKKKLK